MMAPATAGAVSRIVVQQVALAREIQPLSCVESIQIEYFSPADHPVPNHGSRTNTDSRAGRELIKMLTIAVLKKAVD